MEATTAIHSRANSLTSSELPRLTNNSEAEMHDYNPAFHVIFGFISGLAVAGNILVCAVILRSQETSRNSYTFMILALAIVDALTGRPRTNNCTCKKQRQVSLSINTAQQQPVVALNAIVWWGIRKRHQLGWIEVDCVGTEPVSRQRATFMDLYQMKGRYHAQGSPNTIDTRFFTRSCTET